MYLNTLVYICSQTLQKKMIFYQSLYITYLGTEAVLDQEFLVE
jgi:hypothetical protein